MAPHGVERKLTAILSADVKGYSRLMGGDEEGTLRTCNRSRGGQARKPAKNEASRIEGCEIRDLSRVEMRLASAPLAVKSRFSRGFWISTLIRYHYPGRERLLS